MWFEGEFIQTGSEINYVHKKSLQPVFLKGHNLATN